MTTSRYDAYIKRISSAEPLSQISFICSSLSPFFLATHLLGNKIGPTLWRLSQTGLQNEVHFAQKNPYTILQWPHSFVVKNWIQKSCALPCSYDPMPQKIHSRMDLFQLDTIQRGDPYQTMCASNDDVVSLRMLSNQILVNGNLIGKPSPLAPAGRNTTWSSIAMV